MSKQAIMKVIGVGAVIAALIWFNQTYLQLTPASLREWITSFGWIAPILYVVLYTVRPLILFPASILSLAGGLAFGAIWGTALTVVGATAGAIVAFFAARYMGKSLVQKEWTGKMKKVQQQMESKGLIYVLFLRMIPLFPFDLISYLAGISKVKFRDFLIGTFFGIIPGTFAYTFLGASFADGRWQDIVIAAAVFVVALIIPLVLKKRLEGEVQ